MTTAAVLKDALTAALAAYGRGALDEASRWLDAAACGGREHPDILHLRGLVALARSDVPLAVSWIERAVRAAPRVASYWNNLGVAQRQAGSLELAAQAHGRAITLAPSYASAHNNLGAVHAEREDYDRAASCFERAIQFGASNADTHANLVLAHARRDDGAAALTALEAARKAGVAGVRLEIAALCDLGCGRTRHIRCAGGRADCQGCDDLSVRSADRAGDTRGAGERLGRHAERADGCQIPRLLRAVWHLGPQGRR